MLKIVTYFGQQVVVTCDGRCDKAWGLTSRPSHQLSDDPDDFAYVADDELGEAPGDPGTYEGGCGKPTDAGQRLNKWCVRECERCLMVDAAEANAPLPDFSKRQYNIVANEPNPAPSEGREAEYE